MPFSNCWGLKKKQPGVMIRVESEELVILVFWVLGVLFTLILGMRNDGALKQQGSVARSGRAHGFISSSFRAFSSYMKNVSSGASTVARSAASVASSLVDKDGEAKGSQVSFYLNFIMICCLFMIFVGTMMSSGGPFWFLWF